MINLELLKRSRWVKWLQSYSDHLYIHIILETIKDSIRIVYQDSDQVILSDNLLLVNKASEVLTEDLNKQIQHDKVIKVKLSLMHQYILSLLRLVAKLNSKWRCIYHLSHSCWHLVNNYISENFSSLIYIMINQTIVMLINISPGLVLVK